MTTLKITPLHKAHLQSKGRMVPFAGFDMPVQYKGLMDEHLAVRENVGLFDVSHMGEFLVTGSKAKDFLNSVTTNDLSKLSNGRCQYNLLCYENGTLVDDIIISQLSDESFLIVVNASNIDKDFQWLKSHLPEGVTLQNFSDDFSLVAVQGPKSEALLKLIYPEKTQALQDLKYYHFTLIENAENTPWAGTFVSRTGYTGEDGFEVLLPNSQAEAFWNQLLEKGEALGVQPCGLGCRDTLRLEAAYSLYGHELSDSITALEAGLSWVVKLDKTVNFIGKNALSLEKNNGSKRKLVGIELTESGIAREGAPVLSLEGKQIGQVTSGTHSPTLKKSIALALIEAPFAELGQNLQIDIRGKKKNASVVQKPFYKRAKL